MMFRGRGYIYSALILMIDILIGGWLGCMVAVLTAVYAFFIGEWHAKKIRSNSVRYKFQQSEREVTAVLSES